jgi:hypothetical protein
MNVDSNCEAHSKFNIPHSRYRQSPTIFFMKVRSNEQGAFMICRVDSKFGRHIMNMQRRPPGHLHMDSVRDVGGFATCFAPSPRRPYIEDKRMVLEHTHGLFIT